MALDDTSTRDEVSAEIVNNASWFSDRSVSKAKRYVTACNIWLTKFAFDESINGPSKMRFDQLNARISKGMETAMEFVRRYDTSSNAVSSGSVVLMSIADFRR